MHPAYCITYRYHNQDEGHPYPNRVAVIRAANGPEAVRKFHGTLPPSQWGILACHKAGGVGPAKDAGPTMWWVEVDVRTGKPFVHYKPSVAGVPIYLGNEPGCEPIAVFMPPDADEGVVLEAAELAYLGV